VQQVKKPSHHCLWQGAAGEQGTHTAAYGMVQQEIIASSSASLHQTSFLVCRKMLQHTHSRQHISLISWSHNIRFINGTCAQTVRTIKCAQYSVFQSSVQDTTKQRGKNAHLTKAKRQYLIENYSSSSPRAVRYHIRELQLLTKSGEVPHRGATAASHQER
jgi:hypothetical protein